MCGIVGLFPYKFDNKDLDQRAMALLQRMLFTESLVYMEPRGKDSTGVALLWDDHDTAVVKQPVKARQFAKEDGLWGDDHQNPDDPDANFKWLMDTWMRKFPEVKLKQALGHVRAGTKGSEFNPHNNHPIIVTSDKLNRGGPISGDMTIGVHNGGIRNDDWIEKKHKFTRIGEVDSEVVFQLIHEYKDEYTIENLQETFDELSGAYAVMAYNPAVLNKVACMRETRPLNAAYIPEIGTLVLISERKYLQHAMEEYERWRIREGESNYSYTDDSGELQELGKVYEAFPYISCDWYDTSISDTMEAGVFVLDLDTEVNAETKAKDLVNVKRIFTRASGGHHGRGRGGNTGSRSGGTTVNDTRASSSGAAEASTPTTTTEDKPEKKAKDGVVDFTDYTPTGAGASASSSALAAAEADEEEDSKAGDTLEVEVDAIEDPPEVVDEEVEEEDDCPWDWNERIEMAGDALYSSAAQLGDKLMLAKVNEDGIQKLLEDYLIKTKTPDEASTILASFYDIIFPEGFALGFSEGWDSAEADAENNSGGDELLEEKHQEDMAKAEVLLEHQKRKITELQSKKNNAQKYISIMRPLLSHLLLKDGVVNEAGDVDKTRLEALKQEAGLQARPNLAAVIRKRVMNKGSK